MTSTIHIIRKFVPANSLPEIDYGVVTVPFIRPEEPRTPQIQESLKHIISPLSSPPDHYNVACGNQPLEGPLNVYFKHKTSDRARLVEAKNTIASFEERLHALEEARTIEAKERAIEAEARTIEAKERAIEAEARTIEAKARAIEAKAKKEREDMVLQWETCDRITQSLNDFLKCTVMKSAEPDLACAKQIWISDTRFRYLPHLFTQWWLFWNAYHSEAFPTLPNALDLLTEPEKADLRSRPPLPAEIDMAAEALWNSEYQPVINLMLKFYHSRPKGRNSIQHPTPSASFAHSFIQSYPHLTENEKILVGPIIDFGQRRYDGQCAPLFTSTITPPLDDSYLNEELEKVLNSCWYNRDSSMEGS